MTQSGRYALVFFVLMVLAVFSVASVYVLNLGQPSTCTISKADLTALNYYTEQFPPYNYQENGTLKGLAVDLLDEKTPTDGGFGFDISSSSASLNRGIPEYSNFEQYRPFLHFSAT